MARKVKHTVNDYIWGTTRISLGLIFLWAFFDKLIGLGFSTCRVDGAIEKMCDSAWLSGGSPTSGYLSNATGPFAETFQGMAGSGFVDLFFMTALLMIGAGLVFGIAVKLSAYSGAMLLTLMYLSSAIWPEHHPFIDDHVIYALVLLGLAMVNDTQVLGFGRRWKQLKIVKAYPIFE